MQKSRIHKMKMLMIKKFFKPVTKMQNIEFGHITVIVSIFLGLRYKENPLIVSGFFLIILTAVVPMVFYPLAFCWFGISRIVGTILSSILLSIVFIFFVVPIGLLRTALGRDNLKLRQYKKSQESVLVDRDHLYTEADLLNTF
jgi:hypothetical protein